MPKIIVVDTNVMVSALLGSVAANRVIDACLAKRCVPLMGAALFTEYEDLSHRGELFQDCPLDRDEREELLDIFFAVCRWTRIHYVWRPNLRDEADNHLVDLAVAGNAEIIVTRNIRDFRDSELRFPAIRIIPPEIFLRDVP
jgi:putative PIN family toxin of toxin-antitoxin system